MKKSGSTRDDDRQSELLYHLRHIVEQEVSLREMLAQLSSPSEAHERAAVLSRIEIEVVYHLGYHLKELRKPLAKELKRAYETLGDTRKADPK